MTGVDLVLPGLALTVWYRLEPLDRWLDWLEERRVGVA